MTKVQKDVTNAIIKSLNSIDVPVPGYIHLEHPGNPTFGDYSSNIAMVLYPKLEKGKWANPRAFAEKLKDHLVSNTSVFSSISVAGPGFINFTLADSYLHSHIGPADMPTVGEGKKVIVEYMQPNTNKPLHVGHLRNAILGKALIDLLRASGYTTIAATVNNDRGLHITKSMWAYLVKGNPTLTGTDWKSALTTWDQHKDAWKKPESMEEVSLRKGDFFVGHWYVIGDSFAQDENVQKAWAQMLQAWENEKDEYHTLVRALWKTMNDWFYQGARESYNVLGVTFDPEYIKYESDIYEAGKHIILENVTNGIFEKLPDGAVRANLEEKYKIPDKILLRHDGTGIYMTFDIELTRQRTQTHADKLIWVVGNDQELYFQQLFAVCEMLGYGKRENFTHFSYGMVRLPEGKMSSRRGTVVYADDVLSLAYQKALEVMESVGVAKELDSEKRKQIAKEVGLGAVKYTMLSYDPKSEIAFDIEKSVTFEGNSGPYIQYTAVRAHSILEKSHMPPKKASAASFNAEERQLTVKLIAYPEVVETATLEYAPHHVATFAFELAQVFNAFYNKHQVIGGENEALRLTLVQETFGILSAALALLGIPIPKNM